LGATRCFLSSPQEAHIVLEWFRRLPGPPDVVPMPEGSLLHFKSAGPLNYRPDKSIDVTKSPLVSLYVPQERRGILWTIGEVHFLPTPLRGTFPPLDRVCSRFTSWLRKFPLVFSPAKDCGWDYYLEGGARSSLQIFALPEGMRALERGQYFVGHDDNELRVDDVVKLLRLRGVYASD